MEDETKRNLIYLWGQSISAKSDVNICQFTIYSGFKGRKIFSFIKQVSIICEEVKIHCLSLHFHYFKNLEVCNDDSTQKPAQFLFSAFGI